MLGRLLKQHAGTEWWDSAVELICMNQCCVERPFAPDFGNSWYPGIVCHCKIGRKYNQLI